MTLLAVMVILTTGTIIFAAGYLVKFGFR